MASRQDEYNSTLTALGLLYRSAASERDRERITIQMQELSIAFAEGVIQDIKGNAGRMHIIIAKLETLMTPTRAKQIADASVILTEVLRSWKDGLKEV